MKTSTLAFWYVGIAGFLFMVSKFLYLNGWVDHWFGVWLDALTVVSFFFLLLIIITHRKPTRGHTERRVSGGTPPTRTPARFR